MKHARIFLNRLGLFAGLVSTMLLTGACQCQRAGSTGPEATASPVRTKASQAAMTPQEALEELREGNARFVAGQSRVRNLPDEVKATAPGQYPFAVILSCLDSRQSSELVFDQGIGDVFSARVAGNVLDDDILGSMEFACKASGAKLIAVIGHSNCGAIKGAVDDVQLGNLTGLLARIKPAIDSVPDNGGPRTSKNAAFVNEVSEANVRLVMQQIPERSPVLREMLAKGEIELVGGMYDLSTGKVQFYDK
jgi:carbonic anhydrase